MELIINDRIRNRAVDRFNSFKVSLKYNSVASTFSFDFYYDPDVLELKEMACIGHMHICQLRHNKELFLTGMILSEGFNHSPVKQLTAIGGYALPGQLEDCSIPTNGAIDAAIAAGNLKLKPGDIIPYAYPLQSDGLSLRQIAEKLIAPFKLTMTIDPAVKDLMEQPFEETTADAKDSIKKYLTELALQKNINVTHNEKGHLYFTRVRTDMKPILNFNIPKGGLPGVQVSLKFDGQKMHSQITVVKQGDDEDDIAGEYTVTNPFVPFIFRPKTIEQTSGTNVDTALAARNARADELRALTLTLTIDRWDVNGKLIKPNNLISIIDPENYIFKKTNFFIESIDYSGNEKEMTAILHCVLPCVYDGTEPVYIFSGINLH